MKIFYVYIYLDPRKPGKYVYGNYVFDYEPFYVGKGCNSRALEHLIKCKENIEFSDRIKEIQRETNSNPIIIFYKKNITDNTSLMIERKIIKSIGRLNKNTGPLYNRTDGGNGCSGKICTPEQRKRISDAHKGHKHSEETKKKMSESHKGKVFSEKHRKHLSLSQKGKKNAEGHKHTNEAKRKISDAHRGFIFTKESKKKMSESHKGKCLTEEQKKKISEALKGRKQTKEHILNASIARNKGKKLSNESKI